MANEEIERKMEFIVEQQAQFAADMMQLREAQSGNSQILTQTVQVVSRTVDVVNLLATTTQVSFKDVNAKIDALVDAQIRTDEQLRRTDEQQQRTDEQLKITSESIRQTNEDLRSLTRIVNQHINEGRNES